jgi:hypothetical protein
MLTPRRVISVCYVRKHRIVRVVLDRSNAKHVDIRSQEEIDKRKQVFIRVSPYKLPEIWDKTAIRSSQVNRLKDAVNAWEAGS